MNPIRQSTCANQGVTARPKVSASSSGRLTVPDIRFSVRHCFQPQSPRGLKFSSAPPCLHIHRGEWGQTSHHWEAGRDRWPSRFSRADRGPVARTWAGGPSWIAMSHHNIEDFKPLSITPQSRVCGRASISRPEEGSDPAPYRLSAVKCSLTCSCSRQGGTDVGGGYRGYMLLLPREGVHLRGYRVHAHAPK